MCGSAPSAPQLPQYPGLTPGQQTNLGQQAGVSQQFGQMIQGLSGQLGNNQNILQTISGLFNQDGTINQTALSALSQQSQQGAQAAGAAGSQALQGLSGIYGQGGSLANTEAAYNNALQGNAPANQALQYQQNQSFLQMQQEAAQRGINITGTNWSNAVSDSTAGQKMLQNYQQNANMQNQQYQLGYLNQLGTNMGQLAGVGAQQAQTGMGLSSYGTQTPLNYLGQSISGGQAALAPYLSQYQNQLSSQYAPLYAQQNNQYMAQMAQAQGLYQGQMNQYNAGNQQLYGGIGLGMQGLGTGMGIASMFL